MKIALITDAWRPQVNGVVTTLVELVDHLQAAGHEVLVVHPGMFETRPCPGYSEIRLARSPGRSLGLLVQSFEPDAIHVATEGPLGWAARRYCVRHRLAFTTAFHTRFPEILKAAARVPLSLGYALFRLFHARSHGVMVPTLAVRNLLTARRFKRLRAWTHGVDEQLFKYQAQVQDHPQFRGLKRPIALYVGRISYEKNIRAFIDMPWQGSKVICGVGPLESTLRRDSPDTLWLGLVSRPELATLYAASDVFVFPSRHETFGLVMLEAMACGTPVAAFPVDGPWEVLGVEGDDPTTAKGGILSEDLAAAAQRALQVPRADARAQSERFSWVEATRQFVEYLVPIRGSSLTGS
jgi:glycosyltransferase involved in cell wall biosynthesis